MLSPVRQPTTHRPERTYRSGVVPASLFAGQLLATCLLRVVAATFARDAPEDERLYGLLFATLAVGFALYFAALWRFKQYKTSRKLVAWVLISSALLRAPLIQSPPILEVDLYRYLWDGAVANAGVSPYRYSPAEALQVTADSSLEDGLARLVALREASPGIERALESVHYASLTTVYPPVSVAVFALADRLSPASATLDDRVLVLKGLLVAFDLGTLAAIIAMLALCRLPVGLGVAYGWCPLVLKEFANSGHLDSIAVFLSACAVATTLILTHRRRQWVGVEIGSGVLLGLGVGAKLFPVVLAPLLGCYAAGRLGVRRGALLVAVAAVVSAAALTPMVGRPKAKLTSGQGVDTAAPLNEAEPLPAPGAPAADGLATFLTRWEMNDFLFMVVVENVRPSNPASTSPAPWFSVTPEEWRIAAIAPIARWLGTDFSTGAFITARAISLVAFGVCLLTLCRRVYLSSSRRFLVHACFLSVAVFWLVAPTQNPWYWAWAMPFAAFGGSRWWLAGSLVAMAYYLRFWLTANFGETPLFGTHCSGTSFYDFVIVPCLYVPWLLLLVADRGKPGRRCFVSTDTEVGAGPA